MLTDKAGNSEKLAIPDTGVNSYRICYPGDYCFID